MNYDEFYNWVTSGYKDIVNINRSRERIAETNEIFTGLDVVLYGLQMTYPEEYFKDPSITFCDSCAGEGVWLVGMALLRMKNGLSHEESVATLRSIDYMEDNVEATLIRLSGNNSVLKEKIKNNFAVADGLRYHRQWDGSYPYPDELAAIEEENIFNRNFTFD